MPCCEGIIGEPPRLSTVLHPEAPMVSLAVLVAITMGVSSGLHVYWAVGGRWGHGATLPERDGRPAFQPRPAGTLVVAGLLAAAALLVLGRVGLGPAAPLTLLTHVGVWTVAGAFLLRGIGDFRLVGLFRRGGGTRFAWWDRRVYTPLALLLGISTAVIAVGTA
jgi:uncharacterized protein DUF3995